MDKPQEMRRALLAWFDAEKRALPWRETRDPYAIWVSEIMLQQTRVAAVVEHYKRFLTRYPTPVALALAPPEDVLAAWSGLGYYRRARMLHHAAKVIVAEHSGSLPTTHEAIRSLPGVGVYTSAAIASIAFDLPVAAVDGNVERVISRVTANYSSTPREIQTCAQQWLDPRRPGDFNQAMMELGAQICTPRAPRCAACPLYRWCRTRGEHPRRPRAEMRSKQIALGLVVSGTRVLLQQRPADAAKMAAMWELPELLVHPAMEPPIVVRHAITNTNYYVRVFALSQEEAREALTPPEGPRKYVQFRKAANLPLTGLTLKVLRRANMLPTA